MRGGKREGAGRKPKSYEISRTVEPYNDLAMEALKDGLKQKEYKYVKLYFEYVYGRPIQRVNDGICDPMVISINKNYSTPEKNLPDWMEEATDEELDTVIRIVEKNSIPFEKMG